MLSLHSLTTALDDLTRQRVKIDAAIMGLRVVLDVEPDAPVAEAARTITPAVAAARARRQAAAKPARKTAARLTPAPPTRTPPPVEKTARAGSVAAPKPAPSRVVASPASAGPLDTRILQEMAKAGSHPCRARDLAARLNVSQEQIRIVLYRLKAAGTIVLTGTRSAARWSLATPPPAPTKTMRADGVELETVFDGRRGQSLTGDYPRKSTGPVA